MCGKHRYRPWTELEKNGWHQEYMMLGTAMNIQDLQPNLEDAYRWWYDVSATASTFDQTTRDSFEIMASQTFTDVPESMRVAASSALISGMDEQCRSRVGYPRPAPETQEKIRAIFATAGHLNEWLPRRPWVPSLHSSPLYPNGARVDEIGVYQRGFGMPKPGPSGADPGFRPVDNGNAGYPVNQLPLMDEARLPNIALPQIGWDEVRRHTSATNGWIVIDEFVYDVTSFIMKHPGGQRALMPFLGKDATRAFKKVGHSAAARIIASNFRVGRIVDDVSALAADGPGLAVDSQSNPGHLTKSTRSEHEQLVG